MWKPNFCVTVLDAMGSNPEVTHLLSSNGLPVDSSTVVFLMLVALQ
jgi:hypothetical protein